MFNSIVNSYGYRLTEGPLPFLPSDDPNIGPKTDKDKPAPMDPAMGDPNAAADPNMVPPGEVPPEANGELPPEDPAMSTDPDDNIDPDPVIGDTDFNDTDVMARIHAVRSIAKVASILDKIALMKEFMPKFDVFKFKAVTKNVMDNIDIFATEDLITFRELILSKMSPNLNKMKTTIKESVELERFLSNEEKEFVFNFEKIIEDYNFFTNDKSDIKKIEINKDTTKDDVLNTLKTYLYKLKKDINTDNSTEIFIFGHKYNNAQCKIIVNDAIAILEKIKDRFVINIDLDNNKNLYFYDTNADEYEIENLHILKSPICSIEYDFSKQDDYGIEPYPIFTLHQMVDPKDIFAFALSLRTAAAKGDTKNKPYLKELMGFKDYFLQSVIKNSFNKDIKIEFIRKHLDEVNNHKEGIEFDEYIKRNKEIELELAYIKAAKDYLDTFSNKDTLHGKIADRYLFKCLVDALNKIKTDHIPINVNICFHSRDNIWDIITSNKIVINVCGLNALYMISNNFYVKK